MKCGLAAFIQPHSCRPRHDSGSALPVSTDTKLGRDELFCPLRMAVSSPCTCRVAALQLQVPASCLFSCTALARLLPSVSWMQGPTPRLLGRRRRAGPWCFIGPSAGRACTCVRPGHGHGPALAMHWQAPDWPWPAGSKPSRLRRPMSLALVGGLGHAGGRGRWQQRPAGLQPNCGWHWHSAMSVCYIRVLGFLLLTGRVYKHDAYVYEISPECEDEGAR
jgi:hypothetical protein